MLSSIPPPKTQEMAIDVPECFVFTVENSKIKSSSTTRLNSTSLKSSKRQSNSDSNEILIEDNELNDKCCYGSLLCLCTIISSTQEEKYKKLLSTTIFITLKLLIITILYITAVISLFEFYFEDNTFTLSIELFILFVLIPVVIVFNIIQYYLIKNVSNLIKAREEFYIIPSAQGSFEMRPSLRLYLAAKKLNSLQTTQQIV